MLLTIAHLLMKNIRKILIEWARILLDSKQILKMRNLDHGKLLNLWVKILCYRQLLFRKIKLLKMQMTNLEKKTHRSMYFRAKLVNLNSEMINWILNLQTKIKKLTEFKEKKRESKLNLMNRAKSLLKWRARDKSCWTKVLKSHRIADKRVNRRTLNYRLRSKNLMTHLMSKQLSSN